MGGFGHLWKTFAPAKAHTMAWRLVKNRLPTKDNLHRRFGLSPEARRCSCCNLEEETVNHLFLNCSEVCRLWNNLVGWLGVSWVAPVETVQHLDSFMGLARGGRNSKRLGGLWICAVWVIWKWRNKVIFNQASWNFRKIEEEIKCRYWN